MGFFFLSLLFTYINLMTQPTATQLNIGSFLKSSFLMPGILQSLHRPLDTLWDDQVRSHSEDPWKEPALNSKGNDSPAHNRLNELLLGLWGMRGSLTVDITERSGMIFHPFVPTRCYTKQSLRLFFLLFHLSLSGWVLPAIAGHQAAMAHPQWHRQWHHGTSRAG